jgi:hypothetical protein
MRMPVSSRLSVISLVATFPNNQNKDYKSVFILPEMKKKCKHQKHIML